MIHWLRLDTEPLPDTEVAQPRDSDVPGLLAAGGSLTLRRLTEAYSKGVFPWYSEGQPVLWWSPDPRMVLSVDQFRLTRSLRKTIQRFNRSPTCELRIDSAFERVIAACSSTPRYGQNGTWIVPDMVQAYTRWHQHGQVHSFETWIDGELAGGLYGVSLGAMFFGESMFSHRTDASKIALAALVCFCRANGMTLIDCQQHTGHLESMGARALPRAEFEARLATCLKGRPPADWTYHPALWARLTTGPVDGPHAEESGS